ncbi:chromate efflux transporter [Tardiphaga sp.]|jgi:chromate transporter|uniref:chromate efflux transporter n=1 Tax=Tardiphaga sp. TaxID=1926292 RepID=UPI0037D9DD11
MIGNGTAVEINARKGIFFEVFLVFLKLGLTSFGGPVAHLGYFRSEIVEKRKWLSESNYADIVALCQFLPGPASSQVGIAIGMSRGEWRGALAAWTAFTLPSARALYLFAQAMAAASGGSSGGWLHGLKVAAVAVVALAILGMARTLTPDRIRASVAAMAMVAAFVLPSAWGQIGGIVLGALFGMTFLKGDMPSAAAALPLAISRRVGAVLLFTFFALLLGLPLIAAMLKSRDLALFDTFYRVGALVFGGGHVVLPLLKAEVVPHFVSENDFLTGYGAAEAVPGPLFTFAAYIGSAVGGWKAAVVCTVAIFLSSFLIVLSALPFWNDLRNHPSARAALNGANAAVVGLLLAAFYDPVWSAGITNRTDFALRIAASLLLFCWKTPPWLVVMLCGVAGQVFM